MWRYTVARASTAHRLALRIEAVLAGDLEEDDAWEAAEGADEDDVSLAPPTTGALIRLFKFARQRAGLIVLGFVLTLAATAFGLVPPYLIGPLVDDVLVPYQTQIDTIRKAAADPAIQQAQLEALKLSDEHTFWTPVVWYLSGIGLAAVLTWLLTWGQGIVMAWASERISADLRNHTYAHLQRLSLEFFGGKRTGDLLSRISTDTERICYFLSDNLVDFATDVLMIIGTVGIMLWLNPALALAALLPFPLIAWLVYKARDHMQRGFQRGGRAWGEMTSILADTIPGIRVVKAFAQEQREIDRFRKANDRIVAANDRVNTVWTFFWPMVALLNQVGLLVVWGVGTWLIYNQQLIAGEVVTAGMLMQFLAYIGRFYMRLESMSRMLSATQRAGAGAQRIFEILDRVPSVPEPTRPVHPGRLRGEIELRNVSFRHGSRPVIEDLSLKIRAAGDDRPGRPQRRRQEHAGQPGMPLLRRGRRRDPGRRHRHPLVSRRRVPPPHRHRAARSVLVLRHGGREHRLRPARRHARRDHRRRAEPRGPTSSSCGCPWVTTRWSASAANRSPAASGSAFRSPGRC